MPCRPTLRTAPGSHSHSLSFSLWITDDVLADAFHRFLRASNACHHHNRRRGRRYGSNVPGPLEAHRRLARRRMGMTSAGAGVQPGGADFGALFGFGGYVARVFDPAKDVTWKPPGIEKEKKDEHWLFPKSERRRKKALEEAKAPSLEMPPAGDPIAESKTAFGELLFKKHHLQAIEEGDLNDLIGFLQSAADEPAARNTARLARYLSSSHASRAALRAFANLILEKVQLGTMEHDESFEALSWLVTHPRIETSSIVLVLDAVPDGPALHASYTGVLETLFNRTASGTGPSPRVEELPPAVEHWLECLRQCRHLQTHHDTDPAWCAIYKTLASRVSEMPVVGRHLSFLGELELCRVSLQHWLPHWLAAKSSDESSDMLPSTLLLGDLRFSFRPPDVVDAKSVLAQFDAMRPFTRRARFLRPSHIVNLLDVFQRNGLLYNKRAHDFFGILMHQTRYDASDIYWIYRSLQLHRTVGVPDKLGERLVRHFLTGTDPNKVFLAYKAFKNTKTVHLSACYNLPVLMAKTGQVNSAAIWKVLSRQRGDEILEQHEREHRKNTLQAGHVDLVHLVAHYFAASPHISHSTAFRRVWECYRYLRDRNAPINTMMTRAFVQAGVIRKLKDFKRPATARFQYVLDLVKAYEGEEAAQKLDMTLWNVWNDTDYRAMRIQHGRAQLSRTLVDDVRSKLPGDITKQISGVRYRLKGWSKGKPRFAGRRDSAAKQEMNVGEEVSLSLVPTQHSDGSHHQVNADATVQSSSNPDLEATEAAHELLMGPDPSESSSGPTLDDGQEASTDVTGLTESYTSLEFAETAHLLSSGASNASSGPALDDYQEAATDVGMLSSCSPMDLTEISASDAPCEPVLDNTYEAIQDESAIQNTEVSQEILILSENSYDTSPMAGLDYGQNIEASQSSSEITHVATCIPVDSLDEPSPVLSPEAQSSLAEPHERPGTRSSASNSRLQGIAQESEATIVSYQPFAEITFGLESASTTADRKLHRDQAFLIHESETATVPIVESDPAQRHARATHENMDASDLTDITTFDERSFAQEPDESGETIEATTPPAPVPYDALPQHSHPQVSDSFASVPSNKLPQLGLSSQDLASLMKRAKENNGVVIANDGTVYVLWPTDAPTISKREHQPSGRVELLPLRQCLGMNRSAMLRAAQEWKLPTQRESEQRNAVARGCRALALWMRQQRVHDRYEIRLRPISDENLAEAGTFLPLGGGGKEGSSPSRSDIERDARTRYCFTPSAEDWALCEPNVTWKRVGRWDWRERSLDENPGRKKLFQNDGGGAVEEVGDVRIKKFLTWE